MSTAYTIIERLDSIAASDPDRQALIFLPDGETEQSLSFAEMVARARRLASHLVRRKLQRERVLLLLPGGPDYVIAFLACLYAGAVAVPLYPPRGSSQQKRLLAIAQDSLAAAALTLAEFEAAAGAQLAEAGAAGQAPAMIAIDRLNDAPMDARLPDVGPDDLAYLQYTSGSTGMPKGVMISHANLYSNCRLIAEALAFPLGCRLVSWVPLFHDLGLVFGTMVPLMMAGTAVFMPPGAFIQKPVRWLRAIERYRGIGSTAPNFAYQMCVDRIPDAEARALDLSGWRVINNGSEPISYQTVAAFGRKFAAAGVRADALMGTYGMAEATLYATCGDPGQASPVLWVDKAQLGMGRAVPAAPGSADGVALVSSGVVRHDPEIVIADPDRHTRLGDGCIGEIWLRGSALSAGYWNRPEETSHTFGAALADDPGRHFLRSGDLGFIHERQLYVTGRADDLIIVRGANHYPQDIERTVESAHPAARKGGFGAAFLRGGEAAAPQLVVVQEVERSQRKQIDPHQVGVAIAAAVARDHGIDVDLVVLVAPSSVPKTSSGKTQRKACRQMLAEGALAEIGRWERHAPEAGAEGIGTAELEQALKEWVARHTGEPAETIPSDRPFAALGLNSLKLVELTAELSARFGPTLSPTLPFEYPTIERLAAHLEGRADPAPEAPEAARFEPIAIIGMGCRVAGADGLPAYWDLIAEGKQAVTEISPERARLTGFSAAPTAPYRWGGFLDQVDQFDAGLFSISPREAGSMDPQQRLLLETAWHALEHAGLRPDSLAGSATGVYVGISSNDYYRLQRAAGVGRDAHSGTGNAFSIAANRISYCLGLRGPSLAIDTACSSSLVAVHEACLSLANGESSLALAGGVNLVLSPDFGVVFSEARMLSPSGRSHVFDAAADGYVRGEGCGVVVLKRLCDAERDGDRVLAVIRGSAVNQDGQSNGLTAPNGLAQQQVIRAALRRAGFAPDSIGYVEAHGTGTPLGDPIEVAALEQALEGAEEPPCFVGAVKANIGHLESAAGIAGLIKTVLVLQHAQIPPVAGFRQLNPNIDLSRGRVRIPSMLMRWPPAETHPRRAGVSSFGFGGTNAHLVLEAAPASAETLPAHAVPGAPCLLMLSAASPASLRQLAARYAGAVRHAARADTDEICLAALARRAHLAERLAVVAATPAELARALDRFAGGEAGPAAIAGRARQRSRLAFVFTGQGTHYPAMGAPLYHAEPEFAAFVDRCDAILAPHIGLSVRDLLLRAEQGPLLQEQRYAQPAITVLELALAHLWHHYGIVPEFVAGHSVGEFAAAHAAGIMDLETTFRLVAARGRSMMRDSAAGAMLSILATEAETRAWLDALSSELDIAAINAPNQIVLSGSEAEIARAAQALTERGVLTKRLNVGTAFHSRLMESVQAEFRDAAADAPLRAPQRRMVASAGGCACAPDRIDYWIEQIRQPVLFHQTLEALVGHGADTVLELGPFPVLSRLGARAFPSVRWLSSIDRETPTACFRAGLGALFVQGVEPRMAPLGQRAPHAALPLYPFDRAPHWFGLAGSPVPVPLLPLGVNTLVGRRIELAIPEVICFGTVLPGNATYLADHRVGSQSTMPASGYVGLMIEAARESGLLLSEQGGVSLRGLQFVRPLVLPEEGVRVQTVLQKNSTVNPLDQVRSTWSAQVLAWVEATRSWELHATGELHQAAVGRLDNAAWAVPRQERDSITHSYRHWLQHGLEYGPAFQAIRALEIGSRSVRGMLELPEAAGGEPAERLSPVLLDAAFQTLGALLHGQPEWEGYMPLPASIGELALFAAVGRTVMVEARLAEQREPRQLSADLALYDENGVNLARIERLTLAPVSLNALQTVTSAPPPQLFDIEWLAAPLVDPGGAQRAALPWQLLVLDGESPPFVDLVAGQAWCRAAVLGPDDRLTTGGIDPAKAAGLLLAVAPLPAGRDPVAHCMAVCMRVQRLLDDLQQRFDLPVGYPLCLVTLNAGDAKSEALNRLVRSGLNGLWRSAAQEYTKFAFRHIGIGPRPGQAELDLMLAYLNGNDETELTIRDGEVRVPRLAARAAETDNIGTPLRADGSYLITGGGSGIGLALAEWLAASGAGRVVLAGRRKQAESRFAELSAEWAARGVPIEYRRVDVSVEAEVEELCRRLAAHELPLRGVFHAAAVLDDRPLYEIDRDSWSDVFRSKATSAMWLDRHTRALPLDMFVMFSSIASTLGSSGQCNYAAANGILDALAYTRRRLGLCASVINWGPWAEVGMAVDQGLVERLARAGLRHMALFDGFNALRRVLARPEHAQTLVVAADWTKFGHHLFGALLPSALRGLALRGAVREEPQRALADLGTLAELDGDAALAEIRAALANLLRQVLRSHDIAALADPAVTGSVRLAELGIDSLMAMELRNRVKEWAAVDLPTHMLIGNSTLGEVADLIYEKVLLGFVSGGKHSDGPEPEDEEVFVL